MAAAASILDAGFQDTTEVHPLHGEITGVYLCEKPLTDGIGFPIGTPAEKYAQALLVEFDDGHALDQFVLDPVPPQIWHLPASEINTHATVTLLSS
ncbi:hypothetical protein [Mycolicibacterium peregrinum]|uniref:hypothetical protein n=1 Tax=Mycolicibacterium peregrinum TaxID=43304 RepID=UPI0010426D53|nr:hypothetical protein [Mycolicibacterium peregrinum]